MQCRESEEQKGWGKVLRRESHYWDFQERYQGEPDSPGCGKEGEQSEPTDFRCVEIVVMGALKTESVFLFWVRNGSWGYLCDCGIGPLVAPEMASHRWPLIIPVSVPLWLQSCPWCESPWPSRLAKGVRKKGERHLSLLHAGRCLQQGGSTFGSPAPCLERSLPGPCLERCSSDWHSSEHHRSWYCCSKHCEPLFWN